MVGNDIEYFVTTIRFTLGLDSRVVCSEVAGAVSGICRHPRNTARAGDTSGRSHMLVALIVLHWQLPGRVSSQTV